MGKFQYAEIEVETGDPMTGTNCQLTIFHADGKDETNAGKFGHVIALAGEQGWELVAGSARTQDSTTDGNHKSNYIFKRSDEMERSVRVVDLNMPLSALVGLLIKVSLAGDSPAIVIGLFYWLVLTLLLLWSTGTPHLWIS